MQPEDIKLEASIEKLSMPENLAVGMMVAAQHEKCRQMECEFDYYGFALGQSPFPVPAVLSRSLQENAASGGYTPSRGIPELREAAAGFCRRHFGLEVDAERVVIGPGTKTLIFMVFSILQGDVIIPSPAWIGYAPQARVLGKSCHVLPLKPENGYRLQPDGLDRLLASLPPKQHLLVLNNPHNPTGNLLSAEELEALAQVCRKHGVLVLADEIYALTTYRLEDFTSMGAVYPEGTFITGGLSKDRSAGGYRLGTCILPGAGGQNLVEAFKKMAATLYSCVPAPIQKAAVTAYGESAELESYFHTTREIHRMMGRVIRDRCQAIPGLQATRPQGGFYFFVDFQELAGGLKEKGVQTSNQLAAAMLNHPHHIATVTGDAIMLPPEKFGARIAFVDYDGGAAYERYLAAPPQTQQEEEAFVQEMAPRMVEGIDAIARFVELFR